MPARRAATCVALLGAARRSGHRRLRARRARGEPRARRQLHAAARRLRGDRGGTAARRALVASADGRRVVRAEARGQDPEARRRAGRAGAARARAPTRILAVDEMSLAGRGIVVTRPRELAAAARRALIEQARAAARSSFPAIEIEELPRAGGAGAPRTNYDLAIFVSPTAVRVAHARMARTGRPASRAAAIGAGTRRELERAGVADVHRAAGGRRQRGAARACRELQRRRRASACSSCAATSGRALLGDTLGARGGAASNTPTATAGSRPRPTRRRSSSAGSAASCDAVTVSSAEGAR